MHAESDVIELSRVQLIFLSSLTLSHMLQYVCCTISLIQSLPIQSLPIQLCYQLNHQDFITTYNTIPLTETVPIFF